eukprot:Rhum_TRINITY_DN11523_c0_g1::Rhum_TRINITY_DN11523_c0_g1_i1::g.45211::m.45211
MSLAVLQGGSGGAQGGQGGPNTRAWHREWNIMKQHSGDFCRASAHRRASRLEGGRGFGGDLAPSAPRARMVRGGETAEDRDYLSACRALKKLSEEAFSVLGEHARPPSPFVPAACCLAALLSGRREETVAAAWGTLAPMLCPSPKGLLAALLTLDPSALAPEAEAALEDLPYDGGAAAGELEGAAALLAQWCLALREYRAFLQATGRAPVAAGVSKATVAGAASAASAGGGAGSNPRWCASPRPPPRRVVQTTVQAQATSRSRSAARRSSSAAAAASRLRSRSRTTAASAVAAAAEDPACFQPLPNQGVCAGGHPSVVSDVSERRPQQSPWAAATPQQQQRRSVAAALPPAQYCPMSGRQVVSYATVHEWLASVGLASFASVLSENEIDIETVPLLTDADMCDMNIPGPAKDRMLSSLRHLTYSPALNALVR